MYPHDNIFNIYYNIGKRTPFLVKRCELGLARSSSEERRIDPNRDRTFLVETVKPRGKYGKAYGKCFVNGKPDDSYRQECYPDIKDEEMFISAATTGVVDCKVDVTEMMGAETYLYLTCEEVPLTARVSPRSTARAGDEIKVAFDVNKIHVFDKETEKVLCN